MSRFITDVGIDLDGVIYPFADSFKIYCKERLNVSYLPDPTKWNFYEDWGIDHETFQTWISESAVTHQVFATHSPEKGVAEAWKELREMGIRIHVMTARPQSAWGQTADWLLKHNLITDSLHFHNSKAFLFNISQGKAAMIDDHVQYYNEAKAANIVPCLLDRPWNQTEETNNRVKNLAEFIGFIKGYNASLSTPSPVYAPPKQETSVWLPQKEKQIPLKKYPQIRYDHEQSYFKRQ